MSRWIAVLLVLAGVPLLADAQDAPELVVAVFAPGSCFPSAAARSEFAGSIASSLGKNVGRPARGVAFARARDLEAAVSSGQVQAAVLDPLYVAGRAGLKLLATVRRGGSADVPMIGLSQLPAKGLPSLRGKRIILPGVGGAERFVANFLLEGEVPAAEFFSAVTTAPDAPSAIAAVAAGQADVALVMDSPEARAMGGQRGLSVVLTTRSIPGPALAWVGTTPDAALQTALAQAAGRSGAGVLGDGWGGAAGGYGAIYGVPASPKPLFGAPPPLRFRDTNVLATPASDLDLPAWTPLPAASPARLP